MRKNTKNRALSLLLALVMALGLLPGTALAAEGENVVSISTAEELADFRDRVNGGENTLNAKLTADIQLAGDWTPFNPSSGYVTDAYAGTFDGGGHAISGLAVNDSGTNGVGLFGTINGATIKNLCVEGSVSASNSAFVGGIIGKTGGSAIVENCSFSGSVSSSKIGSNAGAGGIVGRVNAGTVTITGCANSANVSGGCAAGILGYCTSKNNTIENCYNTGTISGSNRTGGIAGQVSNTTGITNCYTTNGPVCGLNGNLTNCYDESNPPSDASQLSSAFTAVAQGNIILAWQTGAAPTPKDPKITITGSAVMYDTNSGPKPSAALTAMFQDLEPSPVSWTLETGEGIVTLVEPSNVDANNTTISVQAWKPGKATVKAAAGEYSDEIEITVWPFVTTVEIDGTVAVGETVKARINVLGGGELDYDVFPVTVQWKYKNDLTDTSFTDISGSTSRAFTITEDYIDKYLSFNFRYQNEDKFPGSPSLVKPAGTVDPDPQPPVTDKTLEEALEGYAMHPVFGRDTNVNQVLEQYLAGQDLEGFTASVKEVKEVYGGAGIAENGDITYFYADPNGMRGAWFGSFRVYFTLTKGADSLTLEDIPVTVYWDANRVKSVMREEISNKVTIDTTAPLTEGLSLPKVIDGKKWTLISWQSSNENVISISGKNQSTADTLFAPYVGEVKRGETDREITLTATFTFQLANDVTGSETPITLVNTYPVTVKALDSSQEEQIRSNLLAKLDAGFKAKGLTDTVTGERLTPDESGVYPAVNDIQLPTTRDFGVDGKYYPVTIATSNGDILKAPDVNNAARVEVFRPGPGQPDGEGAITVTLHDKDTSMTASRSFQVKVSALTQEEIDRELALMAQVKAAYFDGLKGSNLAKDNVRTDLTPFFEVYEQNGELVWGRTNGEKTGRGIVPVPIEGWEDLELWRLFQSSNPNVISHENLLVTRQTEAKAVTVTSRLSSETLGRYGALYLSNRSKYAQYAGLERLYYQEVTTNASIQPTGLMARAAAPADTLIVRGTRDPDNAVPVVETLDVTFSLTGLDGAVWMSASFTGLDESSTVYDVFVKALGRDYTATWVKGTYIKAVSGPYGSLSEKEYGDDSGWMYRVNGRIPDVYMGACPLHSGDTVQVFYTRDAKRDDPNYSQPSGGSSSGNSSGNSYSSGKTEPPNQQTVKVEASGNTYTITLPENSKGPQLVTIPNVKQGQLVVIVHAGGQKETVKKSILENGRAKFLLEQNAAVMVEEYSNPFGDVDSSTWYASAVDFAAGRGLFAGVNQNTFAPDLPLTRGMLTAILFCLDVSTPI